VLGDDDFACDDETAGSGAGGFHEGLPVATGFGAADKFCGFGGADGFGIVAVGSAFGEEREDGGFEVGVFFVRVVAAAGFAAEFNDVPVLLVFFLPLDGTAAGLAELVFVRGGEVGFVFAVGHD
jgi:hypothetical protein